MAVSRQAQRMADKAERIRKGVYEEGKTLEELRVAPAISSEAPVTESPIPASTDPPPAREQLLAEDFKKMYEDLKHQHEVLKGKNDSEVPELVSANRMMAGQLTNLQLMISDLQSKVNAKSAEEPTPIRPDPKQEEDLQSFTDNYPEIERGVGVYMRRWATSDEFRGIVKTVVEEVVKGVSTRMDSVEKKVEKSAEDTFADKMDRLVRDDKGVSVWRKINDDPGFAVHLKNKKYRGVSDFDLLRNALAQQDADTVAEFFNEYQAIKNPPKKIDETPVVDETGGKVLTVDEEALAPPKPGAGGKVLGGGNEKPDDKPITRSFIAKFHTDVALGRYKNKPKERDQITLRINKAMTMGQIVNA